MHLTQPFAETRETRTIDISYVSLDPWDRRRQFSRIRVKPTSAIVHCLNEAERKRSASLWAKFNTFLPSTTENEQREGSLPSEQPDSSHVSGKAGIPLRFSSAYLHARHMTERVCKNNACNSETKSFSHSTCTFLSMFSQIKIWMPAVSRYFR